METQQLFECPWLHLGSFLLCFCPKQNGSSAFQLRSFTHSLHSGRNNNILGLALATAMLLQRFLMRWPCCSHGRKALMEKVTITRQRLRAPRLCPEQPEHCTGWHCWCWAPTAGSAQGSGTGTHPASSLTPWWDRQANEKIGPWPLPVIRSLWWVNIFLDRELR